MYDVKRAITKIPSTEQTRDIYNTIIQYTITAHHIPLAVMRRFEKKDVLNSTICFPL